MKAEAVGREGKRYGGPPRGAHRRPGGRAAVAASALLVAVALPVYLYAGFGFARGMSAPGPREVGTTPASVGLAGYREVSLRSEDGVALKAWWVPAGNGVGGREHGRAAILVHGWHGSRSASSLLATAKIYHRAGYAVLMPSLRAHGGSGGERVSMAEEEPRDVRGAISWLGERGYDPGRVVLHGWSMGGATVVRAAPGTGVAAVVQEAGFADLRLLLGPMAPGAVLFAEPLFGYDLPAVRPYEEARQLRQERVPLFVIHSTTDAGVPYWHARLFMRAYPEAELWTLGGYGHVQGHTHPDYEERVLRFLDGVQFETPGSTPAESANAEGADARCNDDGKQGGRRWLT